ncbi:response regulator [Bradyrhizobium sp.]|uniref:response regulator n=1 Tax=Bradyrhizobium sp. TaxID=376 RepID=UPI002D3F4C51|nr:response regulator [Bradyrhizobium sp.]HZR72746.1 response regulator [Bradyrhizobium sp.]
MNKEIISAPFRGIPSGPPQRPREPVLAPGDRLESETPSNNNDRILIVEDDLLVASEMEATLCDAGFEIVGIATTGNEALQLARTESPILAVMDIRIAGDRDGVDTALELFRSQGLRCIFASAHSDHDSRLRAQPAAPLGWLQKPYTMASLTEMVRAAVSELRGQPG